MHYFCRKRYLVKSTWIITLALVLRSFIAPGFMLDTSSGNRLTITICYGPAGLYASFGGYPEHHSHHHVTDDENSHQKYITPTCSHWSTSSMLVFNFFVDEITVHIQQTVNILNYETPLFLEYVDIANFKRAPPTLV